MPDPLSSPAAYATFIYTLPERYSLIQRSTLAYIPYPNDPTLASTHPHHKHVHPNIKRNRIPAPYLSFTRLNLPFLIGEIEKTVLNV